MNLPKLHELPSVARTLDRLGPRGFGFIVCVVPSRGAAEDADRRLRELAKDQGRAIARKIEDREPGGALHIVRLAEATPAMRAIALQRLVYARDAFQAAGQVLMLIVLEADLPMLTAAADLWTVRTAVVRHGRLAPPVVEIASLPEGDREPPAALVEACQLATFQGLSALTDEGRLPPSEMDALHQELRGQARGPEGQPLVDALLPLLLRHRVTVLSGAAGGGKSTALRGLALRLAKTDRAIVLVSLPRLDLESLDIGDLASTLRALCAACPWNPQPEVTPWVLLDGLDEIGDPAVRGRICLVADDLVRSGFAERAVVAGRSEVMTQLSLEEGPDGAPVASPASDLAIVEILPLQDDQIRSYLADFVQIAFPEAERAERLHALLCALGLERPARPQAKRLRALCGRPLFLTVVAAFSWSHGRELGGEAEILDACIDALIRRRRAAGSPYQEQDLRQAASELAWRLYKNRTTVLPVEQVLVEGGLLDRDLLHALRVGTGLLVDDPVQVAFVHALILDYLVAEQVVDREGWEGLGKFFPFNSGVLDSVRMLLVEVLADRSPRQLTSALARLVKSGEPPLSLSHFLRLLNVVSTLAAIWGQRPPLLLQDLRRTVAAALHLSVRDPQFSMRWRWMAVAGAAWLDALGLPIGGGMELIAVDQGWELARWPVTNALYGGFIEDSGYDRREFWDASGWKWRQDKVKSRSKDMPEGWGLEGDSLTSQPVHGINHHEARAFLRWLRAERQDPQLELPPIWLWEAAARRSSAWSLTSDRAWDPSEVPPVGAAIHRATTDGIEDLGFLVRELLAEEEDQREPWGGYAWCETPIPLRDSVRARGTSGLGRRWYHVYGLRLARRPG